MREVQRPIETVRPALSHLARRANEHGWQQWLATNKPAVIASVCIFSLLAVSTLLASRYQIAAPLPSATNPQTTKASTTLDQATAATLAPFAKLTLEQAQQAARDELGRFVEQQLQLEQRFNLGEWSIESMDGATDTALVGDEYFQTEDYLNALASYQQAADQIAETIQLGQAALAQAIDATVLAIDNLNPTKATSSLSQARKIAPSDAKSAALQERIDALPDIIALLRRGRT